MEKPKAEQLHAAGIRGNSRRTGEEEEKKGGKILELGENRGGKKRSDEVEENLGKREKRGKGGGEKGE